MPRITRVVASFSRQANDGNYGSETVRCELVLEEVDGLGDADVRTLLAEARRYVHEELAESPNSTVRRAVALPELEAEAVDEGLAY